MLAELPEPKPRELAQAYRPFEWPTGVETVLPPPPGALAVDLARLALERQTRRAFDRLPVEGLSGLLGLTCRAHSTTGSPYGFEQQFRAVISAGAIHPIHVLVQRDRWRPWERYDPLKHSLCEVSDSTESATAARSQADSIVHSGHCTLLALVAEPGKTNAKYTDPETLIWRDAGVLIGALSWVAEAQGLSLCPLGVTGTEQVRQLGPQGTLFGVGMLLVGARPAGV